MYTAASISNFPQPSCNYSPEDPEDLEVMRHAFVRACDENPTITTTAAQRYGLAKAIVSHFERRLSEADLIAAALAEEH